jgi:hypothetical protein
MTNKSSYSLTKQQEDAILEMYRVGLHDMLRVRLDDNLYELSFLERLVSCASTVLNSYMWGCISNNENLSLDFIKSNIDNIELYDLTCFANFSEKEIEEILEICYKKRRDYFVASNICNQAKMSKEFIIKNYEKLNVRENFHWIRCNENIPEDVREELECLEDIIK